jgi:uncharacterized membrane protein YoaK (UPF0700 family)
VASYSVENDRWLTFGLAFVGGFGDASGLLLAHTFTGHVTGNLVLVAIAAATGELRTVARNIGAIATFLCGIFLSALLGAQLKRRTSSRSLPVVMMLEVVLIGTALLAFALHAEQQIAVFIFCMALSLGLQNGALRSIGGTSVHTTYLTGMITSLFTRAADKELAADARVQPVATDPALQLLAGIWMSFLLGAATGATMIVHFRGPEFSEPAWRSCYCWGGCCGWAALLSGKGGTDLGVRQPATALRDRLSGGVPALTSLPLRKLKQT